MGKFLNVSLNFMSVQNVDDLELLKVVENVLARHLLVVDSA